MVRPGHLFTFESRTGVPAELTDVFIWRSFLQDVYSYSYDLDIFIGRLTQELFSEFLIILGLLRFGLKSSFFQFLIHMLYGFFQLFL